MQSFLVRMDGSIGIAPFGRPSLLRHTAHLSVIVSRCGAEGDLLTISIARCVRCPDATKITALVPLRTIVGILSEPGRPDEGDYFLLLRELPPGLRIAGRFLPSEGAARIRGADGDLELSVWGRHAQKSAAEDAETSGTAFDGQGLEGRGFSWTGRASRTPWIGDFVGLDPGRSLIGPRIPREARLRKPPGASPGRPRRISAAGVS